MHRDGTLQCGGREGSGVMRRLVGVERFQEVGECLRVFEPVGMLLSTCSVCSQ